MRWGTFVSIVYGVLIIIIVALITSLIREFVRVSWFLAYLAAINVVSFGVHAYDKVFAATLNRLRFRVPERILSWGLALPGGIVGAWAAMLTFHHKTGPEKHAFRRELLKASALTILLAAAFCIAAFLGIAPLTVLDRAVELVVTAVLGVVGGIMSLVKGLLGFA